MKRSLLFVLLYLMVLSSPLFAEDKVFKRFPITQGFSTKIHTVSPGLIHAGRVTQLIVRGQDFLPRNDWVIPGVRILKERYVDSTLVILTVFAEKDAGLKQITSNGSAAASMEVRASATMLADDFEDGDFSDWNITKGTWTPETGQVRVNAGGTGSMTAPVPAFANGEMEFDVNLLSGRAAGIYFQYRDSNNYRLLYLDSINNVVKIIDRFNGRNEVSKSFPFAPGYNTPHHCKLTVLDQRVIFVVDGNTLVDYTMTTAYNGTVALYARASSALFDNVTMIQPEGSNQIPLIEYSYVPSGSTIQFDASGSTDPDGTIVNYKWDFGDRTSTTGVSASHKYAASGTFTVVLTLTDSAGAKTKTAFNITITATTGSTDKTQIQQIVTRFLQLYGELLTTSAEVICSDFSKNPACPARDKQMADVREAQRNLKSNEVIFLSDVFVQFQSATEAYPVKVHNIFRYQNHGDPVLHETDGWHFYRVNKESDGKWRICSYNFQTVSSF